MNIEEDFNKRSLKQRKNGIYLSDEQINILEKYNINYLNYNNINELIFYIEDYLNNSYMELEDLESVSEALSNFNYYNNTNKYGTRNYYYICTGKIKYGVSYCNNSNKNNHVLYKILLNHLINFKIPTVDKKIIAKPL